MSLNQENVTLEIDNQIDASFKNLKWNVDGLFGKLETIQLALNQQLEETPTEKINERKKLKKWLDGIITISKKIKNIREKKIVEIESKFQCKFKISELVILSLIRPSACKLFEELKDHFKDNNLDSISEKDFNIFINMKDATKVLALIGDAVINLAIIKTLWDSKISNVGDLSKKRDKLVSNKILARISDQLKLYEDRVHLDPETSGIKEDKMNKIKGTIVEALFGVIYYENGFKGIVKSLNILK